MVLMTAGCAGSKGIETVPAITVEYFPLDSRTERVEGTDSSGRTVWTAVRSSRNLVIEVPELRGGVMVSRDAGDIAESAGAPAVLNGSPHSPVRFSPGRPQETVGFYRADGTTYSLPDGRHDAVGISPDGIPVILTPAGQEFWQGPALGGFYSILIDSRPRETVPVRDAVSAVGWNAEGSLCFLVIAGRDGRGFSYGEAGALLAELGATDGLALDGGGSARLTWREDGGLKSFPAGPARRFVPNFLTLSTDTP
jgi:hypothetical protein